MNKKVGTPLEPTKISGEESWMKRNWWIILIGIAVIGVIVVGIFIFLNLRTEPSEEVDDSQGIEDAEKMRIVTNEEPPTNYHLEEGEFTGTTVDIVEEIKRYLNLDVEIEVMPWARAYETAKTDSNVVIFTAARTQERIDHGFNFIGPVITRKHALWSKKGNNFNISSIEDIRDQDLRIGVMRGDWREKYFIDRGFSVDSVTDHRQNLVKLLERGIDLWVSSDIEAPPIAREAGVSMEEIEIAYVFREASSYIMLSKDTPEETVKEWEEVYAEIQKTDFFEDTSKKWSSILGSEVGYANDTGFFIRK